MKTGKVIFTQTFKQSLFKLSPISEKKFYGKLEIFLQNPFYPSLRIHRLSGKLEGYRSISIDKSIRVIFEVAENGDKYFIVIGSHSVYEKLGRKVS